MSGYPELPMGTLNTALRLLSHKLTQFRRLSPDDPYAAWPEDDWITISQNYDLKLYRNENKLCAVIYPVLSYTIDTSRWWTIFEFHPEMESTYKQNNNVEIK